MAQTIFYIITSIINFIGITIFLILYRLLLKIKAEYYTSKKIIKEELNTIEKEKNILLKNILKYELLQKQYYETFSGEMETEKELYTVTLLIEKQNEAIHNENYELAAELQEQINKLTKLNKNEQPKNSL